MSEIINLTENEIREIEDIYERKIALENLIKIIDPDNEDLYNKFVKDYTYTTKMYNEWWTKATQKYKLNGNYYVDFHKKLLTKND